jgi:hypothetical protein
MDGNLDLLWSGWRQTVVSPVRHHHHRVAMKKMKGTIRRTVGTTKDMVLMQVSRQPTARGGSLDLPSGAAKWPSLLQWPFSPASHLSRVYNDLRGQFSSKMRMAMSMTKKTRRVP